MIDPNIVETIISQGVTVGVLMWFMFRMEKRIEAMTNAIKELCKEVAGA